MPTVYRIRLVTHFIVLFQVITRGLVTDFSLIKCQNLVTVSYTHLDVYKRQAQGTRQIMQTSLCYAYNWTAMNKVVRYAGDL